MVSAQPNDFTARHDHPSSFAFLFSKVGGHRTNVFEEARLIDASGREAQAAIDAPAVMEHPFEIRIPSRDDCCFHQFGITK